MVEWRPLIGALPPLGEAEWNRVFDLYKQSPEFQKKNFWMELDDFKYIFFWEWFHRLFGRLIGIIYSLPFLFFFIKGWIPKGYKLKLFGLFLLGGSQGLMGWYMVQSGLIDNPAVSHYRLAAHLSLAFLIYGLMLWLGLKFRTINKQITNMPDKALQLHGIITLIMLCVTIIWGAFVAGLDAGLVYTDSFPKMGDTWIPEEMWFHKPYWLNMFESHAGVQFTHRWIAMLTFVVILSYTLHAQIKKREEWSFKLVSLIACIQVILGILTLLYSVPLSLGTLHQAGAISLFTLLIVTLSRLNNHVFEAAPLSSSD